MKKTFAQLSIEEHLDQAVTDLNKLVASGGLTPASMAAIERAIERLGTELAFAKQMAGEAS